MDIQKTPGVDHPISMSAAPGRMHARYQGHVIADSDNVIILTEAGYRPVCYFPREDVAMDFLARTDRDTHCPYKGHATYFTITMDGVITENTAWSYEAPYPAMAAIAGRIAFFPHDVDVYQVGGHDFDASTNTAILHTDSGTGASQAEHWPATTRDPD